MSNTKIAVYWRAAFYLISAGMTAKAFAGFVNGEFAESVGDLGLSFIFVAMCFRSSEIAVLAYISDPVKREHSLRKMRAKELAERPWISWIIRTGWFLLIAGVGIQLSGSF